MGEDKKLKSVKISRAEYLSEEDRKKHNLPDEGMIAMETWEVKTLAEQVLEELVKVNGWSQITWERYAKIVFNPDFPVSDIERLSVGKKTVERAVVLALSAKQAEVLKIIKDLNNEKLTQNDYVVLMELEKRLLAKSEAKK